MNFGVLGWSKYIKLYETQLGCKIDTAFKIFSEGLGLAGTSGSLCSNSAPLGPPRAGAQHHVQVALGASKEGDSTTFGQPIILFFIILHYISDLE